ncbi:MAG: DUF2147 domain-containing protein [Rhodospirillales bacterium]|nr:DUF2147 domain-containing protein [Rhodospirillales bacterium]
MIRNWLSMGFSLFVAMTLSAGAQAGSPKGIWLTESKKAHVEVYDCGDKLCGKIVWLKEPLDEKGMPKLDKENEDEKLRDKPLMGQNMISDMVADGENAWDDGTIYNAEDGKTYSSEMNMPNDKTLNVSGCVLFFCKEQVWTRVN